MYDAAHQYEKVIKILLALNTAMYRSTGCFALKRSEF
jgi:hypothetical protein